MGLFGGGESEPKTQIIDPGRPKDIPLEGELIPLAQNMINAFKPFSHGPGYQYAPQGMFGQVYVPGPNPTLFGNPYSYQQHQQTFGAQAQAPTMASFGIPQQGGGGQQNSGGGQQQQGGGIPSFPMGKVGG